MVEIDGLTHRGGRSRDLLLSLIQGKNRKRWGRVRGTKGSQIGKAKEMFDSSLGSDDNTVRTRTFLVLQCVAVCCSVLQCIAIFCSVLQCVAVCCSASQCVSVCCSVYKCVAVWCYVLQRVAVWCCSQLPSGSGLICKRAPTN